MSKKYFITGGGTGGHIYPAIAVADKLAENNENEIFYVGCTDNLEFSIAKMKGYKFLPIKVKGMPRKLNFYFIIWGLQLVWAIIMGIYYLNKYRPDAIFGTGGYVSAPILFAAVILKKFPFMLHDCDIQPGIVTRKLSPKAKTVSLAFNEAQKFIDNDRCYINGNPIRPEFETLNKAHARKLFNLTSDRPILCVMGGSQGAVSINNAFVEIIKELSLTHNFQIIFQTGKKNYYDIIKRLSKLYRDYDKDKNIIIRPYFDDMIPVIKSADIVISRAGSLSLSEIFASDVAPILIPYPHAAADHQRKNAQFVAKHNGCIYLEDDETNPNSLLEILLDLKENPDKVEKLKEASSKLAKINALNNIIKQLKRIAGDYE